MHDNLTTDTLRTALSAWLTMALDAKFEGVTDADLLDLRDWIDTGCTTDMPEPQGPDPVNLADRVSESVRVFWETKNWTAAQWRRALVEERLR